jgi:hypothetical protein
MSDYKTVLQIQTVYFHFHPTFRNVLWIRIKMNFFANFLMLIFLLKSELESIFRSFYCTYSYQER